MTQIFKNNIPITSIIFPLLKLKELLKYEISYEGTLLKYVSFKISKIPYKLGGNFQDSSQECNKTLA